MEFFEAVAARHSTRAYSAKAVPESTIRKILAAASASPVGMGRYDSLSLTAVTTPAAAAALHAKILALFDGQDPLYGAPAFILVSSAADPAAPFNVGCVMENMLLAAAAEGLGSCYIGGAIPAIAADAELSKELGVPEGFTPMAGIAFGFPKDEAELSARKDLAAPGRIAVTRL